MALDRQGIGKVAAAAEARVVRGGPGGLPRGIAYVLVVHDPTSRLTTYATNVEPSDASDLLNEVIENILAEGPSDA
jgi:hypothetical protein